MSLLHPARLIFLLVDVCILFQQSEGWLLTRGETLPALCLNNWSDLGSKSAQSPIDRRSCIKNAGTFCSIAVMSYVGIPPAFAVTQEDRDKANILKGYQRLSYLIENWDKETTLCNTSNDNPYLGCDRTPLKVMEYLGFKNTDDPLFKADKTMLRLQRLVPAESEEEYLEAMETWVGTFLESAF